MSNITKFLMPFLFLLCVTNLHAFVFVTTPTVEVENEVITVEQFLDMSPASMEAATGKKMGWGKKRLFKMAQRKIKKRLAKGEVTLGDEALADVDGNMSLIAAISGGAALFFLLLGVVSGFFLILSLLAAIAGIVFGIIGLKKEDKSLLAALGIIGGGVIILLWLLIVALFSAL